MPKRLADHDHAAIDAIALRADSQRMLHGGRHRTDNLCGRASSLRLAVRPQHHPICSAATVIDMSFKLWQEQH